MKCIRCGRAAVIYQRYSGRHLCAEHLIADIESRAKRVIRQNQWLVRGDRIGGVSGLPGSAPLGMFLDHLVAERHDISIVRICPPQSSGDTSRVAWYQRLSQMLSESGVTRIALSDCADDLAELTLYQVFTGDTDGLLSSGIPGLTLPYIQPFREIPAEELRIYYLHQPGVLTDGTTDYPPIVYRDRIWTDIHSLLEYFSSHHPSASHALRRYRDNLQSLVNAE